MAAAPQLGPLLIRVGGSRQRAAITDPEGMEVQ
jgi:hypothetical protein